MTRLQKRALLILLAMAIGTDPSVHANGPTPLPDSRRISIFHTNDVHSHYRPDPQAPHLGGLARLKTLLDRLRAESPTNLLVDGGDWTEGQLYYYLGAGLESYRMMNRLGYDVAVLGNHDFLNGPDVILDVVTRSGLNSTVLASNTDIADSSRSEKFRSKIPQFTVREIGGVKIGFIGLLTYEFIYDTFLKPVKITSPFEAAKTLSQKLKKEWGVQFVVGISHNRLALNRKILEVAPDVDLIVGAHDHKKLSRPIIVNRPGAKPGWLVETGSWGRYLGRVDLEVKGKDVGLASYRLYPVEPTLAEDPEILATLSGLEDRLEAEMGPIFHDHVGDCEADFHRDGTESEIGNLVTDAVREFSGADLAIDHPRFIYGGLAKGPLRTADLFNVLPGVYNPSTGKSWTVKTLPIKGATLQWLFNVLLAPQKLADGGAPSVSGLEVVYDSPFRPADLPVESFDFPVLPNQWLTIDGTPVVKKMTIRGEPVQSLRQYKMAFSGGIYETLLYLNQFLPGTIPLEGLADSGRETKRVFADYVSKHSPILAPGDALPRLRPVRADLSLPPSSLLVESLETRSGGATVRVSFKIRNQGLTASDALSEGIHISGHRDSTSPLIEITPVDLVSPLDLPSIPPGGQKSFSVELSLPLIGAPTPIWVQIDPVPDEANDLNNDWLLWFSP